MRWTPISIALMALAGCGGTDSDKDGTTTAPTAGIAPCPDTGCEDTGKPVGPQHMEPVAVGFEILATIHADGSLHPMAFSDGSTSPPMLMLTFADAIFFSATDDVGQAGHFCEVGLDISAIATAHDSSDPAFVPYNGSILNWSTEFYLDFSEYYNFQGTDCASVLDTAVWGADGSGLLYEFQGAHVGIGYGPMTDYIWDSWGGKDATGNEDYLDKFMAEYVALNDREGHWGGCDWGSALFYGVDPATDIPIEDAANPGYFELPLVTENIGNGTLPHSRIQSFAYWYQDFDLISLTPQYPWDFSHLGDPGVGGQPLCDQG